MGRYIAPITISLTLIAIVALAWWSDAMDRLVSMVVTTIVTVAIVFAIWLALNLVLDRANRRWSLFTGLIGALVAATMFAVARGTQTLRALVADPDPIAFGAGGGVLGHIEWPIAGALIWGGGLALAHSLPDRFMRLGIGAAMGAVTAWLVGRNTQLWQRPDLDWTWIVVLTAIGAGIAYGSTFISGRSELVPRILLGSMVGSLLGTWFVSPFGGTQNQAIVGALIPLVLLGLRLVWNDAPDPSRLAAMERRARAAIFLGPALLFLSGALVIPAIRTVYLSFLDREGREGVGFDNYETLLRDPDTFDVDNWSAIFTSQLFWVAVLLIGAGVLIGTFIGTQRNGEPAFDPTASSVGPIAFGLLLFAFAVFSVLRGTFFNNMWWIVTVTILSVALGLLVAVLAERAGRLESFAKSFIFMPLAVSFVGASIVWRLQYQPRDPTKTQTGVLNALWVELGQLSHSGAPRVLVLIALAALGTYLIYRIWMRWQRSEGVTLTVASLIAVLYLFVELGRRSLGGFRFGANGEVLPDTIIFLQEPPFNNVFLMIILIWIQTGFAMVILSAAIKAVPQDYLEAAKVDGANESQTFFSVILPSILPTVGVVTTTLIVLVSKVFDIVKVTTGGNFGTNVLANDMFTVSFSFFNVGLGSAIATAILLLVLPVMVLNIRRMQAARA